MTLQTDLAALEASGLVRLSQIDPELEYLFRHALIQDAAYNSLLKTNRRALHRAVGEALERTYPERRDELAPLLGQHFLEAGDQPRALTYFSLAGDAALQIYANAEAALHYAHALEIAQGAAGVADSAQLLHLYTGRGRALELTSRYPEALNTYTEMQALARKRGDRSLELAALTAQATIYSTPTAAHDSARGQALAEQALSLARELGDRRAEARILWNLMLLHSFTGQVRAALDYGEQALHLARELDLREELAYILNDLFRSYVGIGQYDRARAVTDEARELWRELGNQTMLADNLSRSARVLFAAGEYERALTLAEEARQIGEVIGNLWGQSFCRMFVGYIYWERGEPGRAIETMETCIRLGEQAGFMMAQVGTRADLGWIYGVLGNIPHGLELGRLAQTQAEQRLPGFKAWALACLVRLHVMEGNLAAAEAVLQEGYACVNREDFTTHGPVELPLAEAELASAQQEYARAVAVLDELMLRLRQIGMKPFLAEALCLKGRALHAQGKIDEAHAVLTEARGEAEALGSRRMLWQILAALSRLEAERGDPVAAGKLHQQARAIIEYVADHIGTSELRASFLERPEVRAVFSREHLNT